MPAPKHIHDLVERFGGNLEAYKAGNYNEAQVRQEFINPMFRALGWDMDNEQGFAEGYKDVIHEDSLRIGQSTKAPDYCFRIGGTRKFFLEAKKPSVNLKDNLSASYQIRRYAWSAKLPLSILTDFEEFAVYDCRVRPHIKDHSSKARIIYLKYTDYIEHWDKIFFIFDREQILKGSFDKYVISTTNKRGTSEVDSVFLKEIETWRVLLAKDIALNNYNLNHREINHVVQKTIDRIIFLRICEDRGIEHHGSLKFVTESKKIYSQLLNLFRLADERYNSGLFFFNKDSRRQGEPDNLSIKTSISDKPLQEIIGHLYYPESPYEFSVLPADILGQIYEQFLGKKIILSDKHEATVEEKPEVRKAGGVYYTPTRIVKHIVNETIGMKLKAKSISDKSFLSRFRILDPACGSGSFALGAFDYLLTWYLKQYLEINREQWIKGKEYRLYQDHKGEWQLTIGEKKRILLLHVYGVDIDQQAVEVTKLSLLLRVLEGENAETIGQNYKLFRERALPDLADNIKCGNSLIGPDIGEFRQVDLFDQEEVLKINAFNWETQFANIFADKGFDVVIGNPPYIGFHGFKEDKNYFKNKYISAVGRFDYYLPFIEKGLGILKPDGLLGYICPTNFMKRKYGSKMREFMSKNISIIKICDFRDHQIFVGALNYTGIFIFNKSKPKSDHQINCKLRSLDSKGFTLSQSLLKSEPWIIENQSVIDVLLKMESPKTGLLKDLSNGISEGIVTGKNDVFLIDIDNLEQLNLEEEVVKPCIRGREIRRYHINPNSEVLVYPYAFESGKTKPISVSELKRYNHIWKYLKDNRTRLSGRSYFDDSNKHWYELWCPRNYEQQFADKIVVPELAQSNRFSLSNSYQLYGDTVCGITIKDGITEEITYILGLLNSRLLEFQLKATTVPKANGFYIYKTDFLNNLSIRRIDFNSRVDQNRYSEITTSVENIMKLSDLYYSSEIQHERDVLKRQIDNLDKKIDHSVFKLYGISRDEQVVINQFLAEN